MTKVNYKGTLVRCSLECLDEVWGMKIHIGERIKKRAEELKIGSTELGELINTSKQNIHGIYKRASIDTQLLYELSKALKFNFFELYNSSELVKFETKLQKELEALKKENDKLKASNANLKEKNALLEKINKLLEKKEKAKL